MFGYIQKLPGGDDMKGTYTEELLNQLNTIGVPAQRGEEADIEIATTFTDAKWTAGHKVIKYHGMISFDEANKTIFMYEKTSESGSGLSFGGGVESSFQSGKTLFRKVKTVAYGLDGKAFEVDLDLGAIPKTVKDYGKQIGWKFKTVLNAKKARSTGIIVPVMGAYAASAVSAEPTQATQPATLNEPQSTVHSPSAQRPVTQQTHHENRLKKSGSLGLIVTAAMSLMVVLVMWISGTSMIGIALAMALMGAGYFFQLNKAWFLKILIGVGVLVLVFGVYIFTTDFSSSGSGFSTNTSSFDYDTAVYSKDIYNLGGDAFYMIDANDLSDYSANKIVHELKLLAYVYQDVLINNLEGDERVVEIRLTNFQWIKAPKVGTLANLSPAEGLNLEFEPITQDGSILYNTDEFSQSSSGWSNTLTFQFELIDLGTYQYPNDFSGTSSYLISAQNLGLKAEDVSFSFKYSIIAKTANGKEYISESVFDAIEGDFIYGTVSPYTGNRVFDYTQGKQFADYR